MLLPTHDQANTRCHHVRPYIDGGHPGLVRWALLSETASIAAAPEGCVLACASKDEKSAGDRSIALVNAPGAYGAASVMLSPRRGALGHWRETLLDPPVVSWTRPEANCHVANPGS